MQRFGGCFLKSRDIYTMYIYKVWYDAMKSRITLVSVSYQSRVRVVVVWKSLCHPFVFLR